MTVSESSNYWADAYVIASNGLSLSGNHKIAAELLSLAIEIRPANEGECNLVCGHLHRLLATELKYLGDYGHAIASIRKAIDIYETVCLFGVEADAHEIDWLYKELHELLNLEDEVQNREIEENQVADLVHTCATCQDSRLS